MKTWVFLLITVWTISASGQVIIEELAPKVLVKVEKQNPSGVQLTMLTPVSGKVVADSVLRVEGVAHNVNAGRMIRLRLDALEQFAQVDAKGKFSAVLPLRKAGVDTLVVEAGGIRQAVDFVYKPSLSAFNISPVPDDPFTPGASFQLEALAIFQSGEVQTVSSDVSWWVDDSAVGRVEPGGRFVAVGPGKTSIYATYGDSTAQVQIDVKALELPAPTRGFSNLTVSDSRVVLRVSDHAEEDGDVVSIYLNDRPVAEFLEIFHKPREFMLNLAPGVNRVMVKAENEGRAPPNTCLLWVITSQSKSEQRFKADQKEKGEFFIHLK